MIVTGPKPRPVPPIPSNQATRPNNQSYRAPGTATALGGGISRAPSRIVAPRESPDGHVRFGEIDAEVRRQERRPCSVGFTPQTTTVIAGRAAPDLFGTGALYRGEAVLQSRVSAHRASGLTNAHQLAWRQRFDPLNARLRATA